jgi:hypothetical protein
MFTLFERNLRHDITGMGAAARARLVLRAGQRLAARGLTSACDADLWRDTFAALAEADAAGLLDQRIYGLVVHVQVDWLHDCCLGSTRRAGRSRRVRAEARPVRVWPQAKGETDPAIKTVAGARPGAAAGPGQ